MQIANQEAGRQAGIEGMHTAAMLGTSFPKTGAGSLKASAGEASDVRFELVARLRAEILTGKYRVTSAQVAEKMMRSMLQ